MENDGQTVARPGASVPLRVTAAIPSGFIATRVAGWKNTAVLRSRLDNDPDVALETRVSLYGRLYGGIMAEQKENSVLFSLKELMNLEEERIKQEEDDKRRAEESEKRRIEDEERRRREEEEAKIRAAEEARRLEERQRQDEEEAKRRAREENELRIRLESERKQRDAEQEKLLEHERKMAELAAQQKKGPSAGVLAAVGLVLVGAIGGGGFLMHRRTQAAQAQAQEVARQAEETARVNREAAERQARETEERQRTEREALAQRLRDLENRPTAAPTAASAVTAAPPARGGGGRPHGNRPNPGRRPGSGDALDDLSGAL